MGATVDAATGFAIGDPDPRLWAYVDRYIGYEERAETLLVRREMPGGFVVLVIGWGAPLDVTDTRDPQRGVSGVTSFTSGLFDSYVTTSMVGTGRGVELLLRPLAAGRILGVPMGDLTNRVAAFEDLPGRWLRGLPARLAEASTWERRFALLDEAIAARLAASQPPDPRVRWAWDRMAGTHGRVGIGELAADLGWSRRHFATVFRREIGLPPKTMARVLRFERAYSFLDRPDRPDRHGGWAAVAARCGYYDQAHLIRDFREFAGAAPTELARAAGATQPRQSY